MNASLTPFARSFRRIVSLGVAVVVTLLTANLTTATAQAAPTRPPASATPSLSAPAPTFADSMTFSKFCKSFNNRARVVQLGVVFMLLALFIIIKKLDGAVSPRSGPNGSGTDSSFRDRPL